MNEERISNLVEWCHHLQIRIETLEGWNEKQFGPSFDVTTVYDTFIQIAQGLDALSKRIQRLEDAQD